MANALVNPIIEAMIANRKLNQESGENASKLALEKEKQKADKEYRDQLINESNERIKESSRSHQAQEDLKAQIAKEAHLKAQSDLYTGLRNAIGNAKPGVNPDTGRPHAEEAAAAFARFHQGNLTPGNGVTPGEQAFGAGFPQKTESTLNFPEQGLSNIPVSGIAAPEDIAQSAGLKAEAVNAPKADSAMRLLQEKLAEQHKNDLERDYAKAQAGLKLQEMKGVQGERLKNIAGQYQQSVAHINATGHVEAAKLIHELGLANDEMAPGVAEHGRKIYEGVMNGDLDPTKLDRKDKAIGQIWATANNTVMPNDAKHKEGLEALDYMQTLANRYRDFANNYSKDSPGGGFVEMHKTGQGGILPVSPLNSALDSLNADAVKASTTYGGMKRLNMAEVVLGMKGAVDPKKTREENLKSIDEFEKKQTPLVRSLFPAGTSDEYINKTLGERGITLGQGGVPEASQAPPSAPKTNPRIPGPAQPTIERHPKIPGLILDPDATQKAGKKIYLRDPNQPTQSPTAVPIQPAGLQ